MVMPCNPSRGCGYTPAGNGLQTGNPCRGSARQPAALIHQQHSDEEIDHRLKEIDEDIRHLKAALRHDLAHRGLLRQ